MIDRLVSPFSDAFADFRLSVNSSCFLCSPYVTQAPIRALVKSLQERKLQDFVHVRVLTDISYMNLMQGSTDVSALLYLHDHLQNVHVTYLPRIHAKVFIADGALAIVGSANFTSGGAFHNYEYGLRVREPFLIQEIHQDLEHYASLGGEATLTRLRELEQQLIPLQEAARAARKTLRAAVPEILAAQERAAEDNLIRIRISGRSVNAIFSDTLLYLLSRGPMTTAELNGYIQQIHSDLCDDAVDRVIDGAHYGKKWKHQVRGAQVSLARQGRIAYDQSSKLWRKAQDGA